jgi:hypothetical protein
MQQQRHLLLSAQAWLQKEDADLNWFVVGLQERDEEEEDQEDGDTAEEKDGQKKIKQEWVLAHSLRLADMYGTQLESLQATAELLSEAEQLLADLASDMLVTWPQSHCVSETH